MKSSWTSEDSCNQESVSALTECKQQYQRTFYSGIVPTAKRISVKLNKANTIQCFFFAGVHYIKTRRIPMEIELKYLIGKTLVEPLSHGDEFRVTKIRPSRGRYFPERSSDTVNGKSIKHDFVFASHYLYAVREYLSVFLQRSLLNSLLTICMSSNLCISCDCISRTWESVQYNSVCNICEILSSIIHVTMGHVCYNVVENLSFIYSVPTSQNILHLYGLLT